MQGIECKIVSKTSRENHKLATNVFDSYSKKLAKDSKSCGATVFPKKMQIYWDSQHVSLISIILVTYTCCNYQYNLKFSISVAKSKW